MLPYPVTANIPTNHFFSHEPLPFPCPRTSPLPSLFWNILNIFLFYQNRSYLDGCPLDVKVVRYSIFLHRRCIGHQTAHNSLHKVSIAFKWRVFVQNAVMAAYLVGILITFKRDSFLNKKVSFTRIYWCPPQALLNICILILLQNSRSLQG